MKKEFSSFKFQFNLIEQHIQSLEQFADSSFISSPSTSIIIPSADSAL